MKRRVAKALDQGEEAQSGVEDTVGKILIQTSVKKKKKSRTSVATMPRALGSDD